MTRCSCLEKIFVDTWFQSQSLQGEYIRLEPLETKHYPLVLEALEPAIFTYMNLDPLRNSESLKAGTVLEEIEPSRLPFVTFNYPMAR